MTDREKQIKAFTLLDEPCPKCAERRSLGVGEKCPDCKPDHIPGVRKKVEIDVVKIRALIDEIAHSPCLAYDGCDDKKCVCPRGIAQKALALLPEPCKTCGGSRRVWWDVLDKVVIDIVDACQMPGGAAEAIDCPDCQSQEPAEKPEGVVFDNKSTIKTASS